MTITGRLCALAAVVAIAGAGTATAAKLITGKDVKNSSLTGADIKNGSLGETDLSKAVRAKLNRAGSPGPTGSAGPAGAKGDTGAQGPAGSNGVNGADGQPGQSGSAAPALLFSNAGLDTAQNRFMNPGIGGGSASEVPVPFPTGAGLTMRDLTVAMQLAPGGGGSYSFTLRVNQVDTALACTVTSAQTGCTSSAGTSIPLVGGDKLSIRATPAGNPTNAGVVTVSMRVVS